MNIKVTPEDRQRWEEAAFLAVAAGRPDVAKAFRHFATFDEIRDDIYQSLQGMYDHIFKKEH